MGSLEYAGGPLILLIPYILFIMIKEEGFVSVLGSVGTFIWMFIKMYLMIVPIFIVLWALSKVGFTESYPELSWIIGCLLGGGLYVALMEWLEDKKNNS